MNSVHIVHIFSCWFMTGAIWMVQLIIYPNFKIIGKNEFKIFHKFHLNRITRIVAPIMMIELLTAAWLLVFEISPLLLWNLFGISMVWMFTAIVNVPTHRKLQFDQDASKAKLVLGNWPRTLIWSLRSVLWSWVMIEKLMEST